MIGSADIAQKWARNGGFGAFGSSATYAGYVPSSAGSSNYVTCVRVRLPAAGIGVQLKIGYSHDAGANTAKKMRYRIAKTPNDALYGNATAATAGDGDLSLAAGSGYFTVNWEGSFSQGEYLYLYLWTGASTEMYTLVTVSAVGNHICTYTAGTASSLRVSGQYLGSPVTVQISRNNSAFTHTLRYSLAGKTGVIASGVETGYTWTPELSVFGPLLPEAVSAVCTVTCETMHGGTRIGEAASAQVTLSLPADCVPAVSEGWIASVTADNTGTAAEGIEGFVQGFSRVKVVFDETKISHAWGAVTAALTAETGGTAAEAAAGTAVTEPVTAAGSVTVRCSCRDSRGRTARETVTVTVMEYLRPSLSGVRLVRCDGTGTEDENGAWILAAAEAAVSSLEGQNRYRLEGFWKRSGGEYDGGTEMESGVPVLLGGGLSPEITYTARITVSDSLGNSHSTEAVIPTAACAFHIREGGKGAAFFGYSQRDGELTVNGDLRVTGSLYGGSGLLEAVYPVGALYLSAAETSPESLFGFGTWERVRDRFLLAAGDTHAAGDTGGEESHTLTAAEMPAHTHSQKSCTNPGNHTHSVSTWYDGSSGSASTVEGWGTKAHETYHATTAAGGHTHTVTLNSAGGGAAHNNMPPWLGVYVWIRTA